jgi:hypothetical protein
VQVAPEYTALLTAPEEYTNCVRVLVPIVAKHVLTGAPTVRPPTELHAESVYLTGRHRGGETTPCHTSTKSAYEEAVR